MDRPVRPEEAAAALAAALKLPSQAVEAARDASAARWAPGVRLVVVVSRRPGEFPGSLELYGAADFAPSLTREALASSLARALQARILTDDGSPNPYTWVLHEPSGRALPVSVEVEALDREEALVLARAERPRRGPEAKRAAKAEPDRWAEVEALRTFYPDSTPIFPADRAQDRSFEALRRAVFAPARAVDAAQAEAIAVAVRAVEESWTAEARAQRGTTLHTLLEAAGLLSSLARIT